MSAVRNTLQGPLFPLLLRPFRPPRKSDALCLPPPSEGCDHTGETKGVPRVGSHDVSPPPSHCSVRGGGGGGGASASAGASNSAASSLPGVGVAGSSHSRESPVLADPPSLVASSVSAGRDCRLCSHEIGGSTRDRSCSRFSHLSPSRGQDSREGRRCTRSFTVSGISLLGPFAVSCTRAHSP